MKKRLNYTNRRSFSRQDISISFRNAKNADEARSFVAAINIPKQWKIDPNAKVYVEAYVKNSSMRFLYGSVSSIKPPVDTTLHDIDLGESPLFRVKVVDESGNVGRLLASADEIRPMLEGELAEQEKSIFPLVLTDLGSLMWKVEISRTDGPALMLTNRIPGLRERLSSDPILRGVILPAAFHQVIDAIVRSDEYEDDLWVEDWKKFVAGLGAEPLPVDEDLDEDEKAMLLTTITERFARKAGFVDLANANLEAFINE